MPDRTSAICHTKGVLSNLDSSLDKFCNYAFFGIHKQPHIIVREDRFRKRSIPDPVFDSPPSLPERRIVQIPFLRKRRSERPVLLSANSPTEQRLCPDGSRLDMIPNRFLCRKCCPADPQSSGTAHTSPYRRSTRTAFELLEVFDQIVKRYLPLFSRMHLFKRYDLAR